MKEQLEKLCSVEEHDGIFIPIDQNWKNVAINVSGGADSAMLAYLVCSKLKKTNIHIISNIRMWKTRPWQRQNSIDVFNWLKNKFPNHTFNRYENLIAPELEYGSSGFILTLPSGIKKSGDQVSTVSFVEYVCHYNNVDAWFSGVTNNPKEESITRKPIERNLTYTGSAEDIEKLLFRKDKILVCHPFIFTTKDWVLKQYVDLQLSNLLGITRSCEGDLETAPEVFNDLDYKTYVPGMPVPECGKCFWCQERNWAKYKNNL